MKFTDRAVLLSVLMIGLLVAFYFLLLAPKRNQASELSEEITTLQSSVADQEQIATFAEQARKQFPKYYSRVVVLGKAVPEQADSASLLVQLGSISDSAQVEFRGIELGEAAGAAPAPAAAPPAAADTAEPAAEEEGEEPPAEGAAPAPNPEGSVPTAAAPSATEAPAPATEATAASLPIGATVGAAGLPTLPYKLTFEGSFFDVADFLADVDGLVHARDGGAKVQANGRLLTVDGFALKGGLPGGSPELQARFALTSYTIPSDQGLTMGAAPGGPAPAPIAPETTPASTVTP